MKNKQSNQLRIIAGKWRGRKLTFADVKDLRPTPDRVRETVFNWLQGVIGDAHCLDLFAGSGALGFESLSRGAATATLVELDAMAAKQLRANSDALKLTADSCTVVSQTAQQFLQLCQQQFDLVFIDPPYKANLWTEISQLLVQENLLTQGAYIYLECPSKHPIPELAPTWHLLKEKSAGDVRFCLFQFNQEPQV